MGEYILTTGDRTSFDLWFKAYLIFWSTGSHPKKYQPQADSLAGPFRILWVLTGGMHMVAPKDPRVTCPLLPLCRKMGFLFADQSYTRCHEGKSDTLWALRKWCWLRHGRQGRSIPRTCINVSRDKILPCQESKGSCGIIISRMVSFRNGSLLRSQN